MITEEPIPAHLQGPLHELNEALGQLRTTRIRASQIEIPDESLTAEELAASVDNPNAPPEIRAIATAVHKGRSTWDEVLEMGVATAVERFRVPAAPESGRPAPVDEEDEDFSETTVLRSGW